MCADQTDSYAEAEKSHWFALVVHDNILVLLNNLSKVLNMSITLKYLFLKRNLYKMDPNSLKIVRSKTD